MSTIKKTPAMFVGTPVLPEFLYENGISRTLDEMQERAGINTVMTFSHDHVFRQYQKDFNPKVDRHGDALTNVWVRTNPEYYADPKLQGRMDEYKYSNRDILDELYEETKRRNMQVYARILEPYVITGAISGFENWREINAYDEETDHVCFNHPEYLKYLESVVKDLIHSHPRLAGFKFGQERGGPLLSALGKDSVGKCFCTHCQSIAKSRGIDVENARAGLIAVHKYGEDIKKGNRPVDGNFVEFLRLLISYPALLPWEQFWMDSREGNKQLIYRTIKSINKNVQVGWHMDHGLTWDLITRATWDYSKLGDYSDWLSVAVYFDSMGRRSMNHFDRNYKQILFGDASEDIAYKMYLSMLGYNPDKQPPLEKHRMKDTSFTSDYVFQECKRAIVATHGSAKVYARPGFDMPGYDCNVSTQQVYEATKAALNAGVDGLWCGREWDELNPENAEAFGNAVRDYLNNK
jgi:hypothetical protein